MQKIAEFELNEILGLGIVLVVTGIGLAYGLNIVSDIKDQMGEDNCNGSWFWNDTGNKCQESSTNDTLVKGNDESINATLDTIDGVSKFPERLPTIAGVLVAAVIIGIITTYMWGKFS